MTKVKVYRDQPLSFYKKEYQAWENIKGRCFNPKCKDYKNYGGRGITICGKWRTSFLEFIIDVGPAPSKKHTIDRIDNNGNYEPGNCRWATRIEQCENKRNTIKIAYKGQIKTLQQWSKELNFNYKNIYRPIKMYPGITLDEILNNEYKPKIERKEPNKRTVIIKVRKRQPPKYYHDLQSVLLKYGL